MPTFEIIGDDFVLDGAPFQIMSGALHYFRIHPDHWRDRLEKLRALGLNTVETYVAWNVHESRVGEFSFDGWRDLGRFLDLAGEVGLHAIVRPGPYICAEWHNGGLPAWLTATPGIRLRTSDPAFLEPVARYLDRVLPIVAERQHTRGGNVILCQIENEYGAYGDDQVYLRALVEQHRRRGIDVPLVTCDQASDEALGRGGLPELLKTATFGSRAAERMATLRRHQPVGPLLCMEFWDGWFDHWGLAHHVTDPAVAAADLDHMLSAGHSVNLYMAHGGTNFGLTNGANHHGRYAPTTTSYDYDAPLAEDGTPTAKFAAFGEVLAAHGFETRAVPAARPAAPAFDVGLVAGPPWRSFVGAPAGFDHLPDLDEVDPAAAAALYEAELAAGDRALRVAEVRDWARFFADGDPIATLRRQHGERALALPAAERLEALVVDQGRVNYGPLLGEPKGLIGPAVASGRPIERWRVGVVDLDRLGATVPPDADVLDAAAPVPGPVIMCGRFAVDDRADLFLDTSGWGQGLVWLNGFALGRYRSAGPTRTLYVPAPLLVEGENRLVVWELEACPEPVARFVAGPDLGPVES